MDFLRTADRGTRPLELDVAVEIPEVLGQFQQGHPVSPADFGRPFATARRFGSESARAGRVIDAREPLSNDYYTVILHSPRIEFSLGEGYSTPTLTARQIEHRRLLRTAPTRPPSNVGSASRPISLETIGADERQHRSPCRLRRSCARTVETPAGRARYGETD